MELVFFSIYNNTGHTKGLNRTITIIIYYNNNFGCLITDNWLKAHVLKT